MDIPINKSFFKKSVKYMFHCVISRQLAQINLGLHTNLNIIKKSASPKRLHFV